MGVAQKPGHPADGWGGEVDQLAETDRQKGRHYLLCRLGERQAADHCPQRPPLPAFFAKLLSQLLKIPNQALLYPHV